MAGNDFTQFAKRPMTVVAVGKTGKGKSTTLNSLIESANELSKGTKIDGFVSEDGPDSKTNVVTYRDMKLPGLPACRLVDTVGLFDTKLTKKRKQELDLEKMSYVDEEHAIVLKQFVQVVELCKDGIDAFFFVMKAMDRATAEEMETIDVIFRYLGWNMLEYVIFIVTGKDATTVKAFEGWKDHICDALQQRGYSSDHVKDRFIFIDNMNPTNGQAKEILELVLYVSEVNRGSPYTPVAFQEAQRALEEEKQKLRAELEAQFQGKVDEKIKPIQERYEKEMGKLQDDINKAAADMAKLAADNVEERKKAQQNINALQAELKEEKRRMDEKTQRIIEQMAKEQRDTYDRQFSQMTALLKTANDNQARMENERKEDLKRMQKERKEDLKLITTMQEQQGKHMAYMQKQNKTIQEQNNKLQQQNNKIQQQQREIDDKSGCTIS